MDDHIFIRTSPNGVFGAAPYPRWLTRWLNVGADLSPEPGLARLHKGKNDPAHYGTSIDFLGRQRVSVSWSWPGVDLQGTVLALSIEAERNGTHLRVEHSRLPRLEQWKAHSVPMLDGRRVKV